MAIDASEIRRIIFDLDNTLFDTNKLLVQPAFKDAAQKMIGLGLKATVDQCVQLRIAHLAQGQETDIYEALVEQLGVKSGVSPTFVAQEGFKAFHSRDIKEEIHLFPKMGSVLEELAEVFDLYLVTLGNPTRQEQKVNLLEIKNFFNQIWYVDVTKEKNKLEPFKSILALKPTVDPIGHLCVGDRIDVEIKNAKQLGMQTVLVKGGEHHLKPKDDFEIPDETIDFTALLPDLL